jgi:PiT family inorganic phosphate transporter
MSVNTIHLLLIIIIVVSLLFTLSNGLHDASSVVATFIACGAAGPIQAIFLAAICGFAGSIMGGTAVANTVQGIVNLPAETALLKVLLAAIVGAVLWNLITWRLGFPSSSTHALVGGLIGAVWIAEGADAILWGWGELASNHQLTGIMKILVGLIASPVLGFLAAFLLQRLANVLLRNAKFTLNDWLKRMQWIIAALLAYSHGANDTQKIVGIIVLAQACTGFASGQDHMIWIQALVGALMFVGTLLGGWPIMRTIGRGIYAIRPIHSLNSQLASGGCLIFATMLGAPVSTTHVVVGSVVGAGAADEFRMVNWNIGKEIIVAWGVTIPASAVMGGITYLLLQMFR